MSDEHAQPKHKYLVMQRHIGMSLPEGESLVSFFLGHLCLFLGSLLSFLLCGSVEATVSNERPRGRT